MRVKARGLRLVVAVVAVVTVVTIVAGTVGLAVSVWQSPHRDNLAGYWSFVAAVVAVVLVLIGGVIGWTRNAGTRRNGKNSGRPLDDVAEQLAEVVKEQWTAAAVQRLLLPEPIPVCWKGPSQPVAGPLLAAADSQLFGQLPGVPPIEQEQQLQDGGLQDLHAVYGGLGSGRLVIVGASGSGKTSAAIWLVLAALKYRKSEQVQEKDRWRVPVPVMFTFHGWDLDNTKVHNWLAARLRQTYPLLFAGKGGADAAELVRKGRVAVILDGLDEIPELLRPVALQALSEQAVFRVVVLARSAEMAVATKHAQLEGAAALELQDVDPQAAAKYLTDVQRNPSPPGWGELIGRLGRAPNLRYSALMAE